MNPLFEALSSLLGTLDRLRFRHCIVGSLASSARGVFRATADGDVVVQLTRRDIRGCVENLGGDWYADPDVIASALDTGRPFNVIHIPSAQKVDIFPLNSDFDRSELSPATVIELMLPGGTILCPVASPEDLILAKLQWYREGGEVSDRQWADITGLLATNAVLDADYLDRWARELGVSGLLARARADTAKP